MNIEIALLISVISVCFSVYFGLKNNKRTDTKDIEERVKDNTRINVKLDDIGQDGLSLIEEIVDIFNVNAIETEIIVASVRNPIHVAQAARMGADIATVPYKVITQMTKHPLTDKGIENFLKDWEGASLKL